MNTSCLDLLQFHWWEYRDLNYLDALRHSMDLQAEGKIKHIGLTNFDTHRLNLIVDAGIKVVSNQVAFSLLDRRALVKMTEFCRGHGISLLAYSSLHSGLMSDAWLGMAERSPMKRSFPDPSSTLHHSPHIFRASNYHYSPCFAI